MKQKKTITINVVPEEAVVTIGLLRGLLPSIIAQVESQMDNQLKFTNIEDMQEVLDEIYEKCIAKTNIREFTQAHINSKGLDN